MFSANSHKHYKLLPAGYGLKTLSLLGLVCLSLLFMQSVDLTHSHNGDVQTRFDCEICLKVGSLEELAIGDDFRQLAVIRTQIFEARLYSLPFLASPSRIARAPPAQA